MASGGLTLSLKPYEKFLVGGAMVENGPRKSSIRIVDGNVFVLRLSDALHPDEVTTPLTRAYHVAQLILACELDEESGLRELLGRLEPLGRIFSRTPGDEIMQAAIRAALRRRYHSVLSYLKNLRNLEAELLDHGRSITLESGDTPDEGEAVEIDAPRRAGGAR